MAYETTINEGSVGKTSPAFAIAERLRPHLANLMGIGGFQALLSRALVLAKEEVSGILVAQLLGLLAAFIGLALTLGQIEEVWPGFSVPASVMAGDEVQSEEAS